jgi:crotonobetainyl-CoA:carnitine CoA-transferase CaiB-like acyl-CoA transferase
MHAAWAFLVALLERDATGRGVHVECSMVEAALNAAAEGIVEFGATGRVQGRLGNRSREAALQGLYACAGSAPGREQWVALTAEHVDGLDEAGLRAWIAAHERVEVLRELAERGIPAAAVSDPRAASLHPQHTARGFFEELEHPVVGRQPVPGVPFRYASVTRWLARPAPTLGQHNREVLAGLLGLDDGELARLEAAGVIGTRPRI